MKKLLITIAINTCSLTFSYTCKAQIFQNIYSSTNTSSAYSEPTSDGGYIMSGFNYSDAYYDTLANSIYLMKTAVNGNIIWTKTYNIVISNPLTCKVKQTADGDYILVSSQNIFNNYNNNRGKVMVIKTNNNGDTLWTKANAVDTSYNTLSDFAITKDGGFCFWGIRGKTVTTSNQTPIGFWAVKTDANFNVNWSKRYDINNYIIFNNPSPDTFWTLPRQATNIKQTTDNGFIMSGIANNYLDVELGCVFKIDSMGNLQNSKYYSGPSFETIFFSNNKVLLTSDGGYLIASSSFDQYDDKYIMMQLVKTDINFNPQWVKNYWFGDDTTDAPGRIYGSLGDIIQTKDRGYALIGVYSNTDYGYYPVYSPTYVLKLDSTGTKQFIRLFNTQKYNDTAVFAGGNSIYQTPSNNFIISGGIGNAFYGSYAGAFLISTDSLGNSTCSSNASFSLKDSLIGTPLYNLLTSDSSINVTYASLPINNGSSSMNIYDWCSYSARIKTIVNNNQITIYPNPNNGLFVIESNSSTKQTLQIFDVNGKLVLTQTIYGKTNIDISDLDEGVYNLSLINPSGIVNKRIVIVR